MNGVPYPSYHPPHARQGVSVHNHDVLCGRGVNIAQHPGNERFRALVSTIHDVSYCTNYTTNEKRALAEDIIRHIKSLRPPGRFLKRSGRSQSTRGLNGPWEELSPKECVKKTCQALRDCNRNDRQGYAAQVEVPTDVQASANQRSASGLSLREQAAAAAAARAHSSGLLPEHQMSSNTQPGVSPDAMSASASTASKRSRTDFSPNPDSLASGSPTMDNAAGTVHKQRRSNDSSPLGGEFHNSFTPLQAPTSAVTAPTTASTAPSLAATPDSSTNSTPATVTRQPYQLVHHYHNPSFSSIAVPQLSSPSAAAPGHSPGSAFHQDPRALSTTSTAPCSPVGGMYSHPIPAVSSSETGMEDQSPPDMDFSMTFHRQVFYHPPDPPQENNHLYHPHQEVLEHHDHHHDISPTHHDHDAVQTAADVAAVLGDSPPIPGMGFPLLSHEEAQHHGSLGIDDL